MLNGWRPTVPDRPVQVVVVAYGSPALLEACLRPLTSRLPVTVVDNSSNAGIRRIVLDLGHRYLDPGSNLGFAAGVNVALREVLNGPPVNVLLLNPDALIATEDVLALQRCLLSPDLAGVAALSPRLRDVDGSPQRVMWPFPHPGSAILEAIGLAQLRKPAQQFAVGAVLLLRWEALQQVGLFDERFFLYAEETDWQRRALSAGWRSHLMPDITVVHVGAGTSSNVARREALFHAGTETYVRKWFGDSGWVVFRIAALTGAVIRAVAPGPASRRSAARLRIRLYTRGPRAVARVR